MITKKMDFLISISLTLHVEILQSHLQSSTEKTRTMEEHLLVLTGSCIMLCFLNDKGHMVGNNYNPTNDSCFYTVLHKIGIILFSGTFLFLCLVMTYLIGDR